MGTTLLYKRACKQALTDTYFDLGLCNKLMKQHPEWGWVAQKKSELEKQERELESELIILNNIHKEDNFGQNEQAPEIKAEFQKQ